MYQTIISDREAGQRLDKYLHRLLPNAGSGFLYKMLRKKNITLNDRKADGSEKIAAGDHVKIFFAQETLDKFMGKQSEQSVRNDSPPGQKTAGAASGTAAQDGLTEYKAAYENLADISVIYENDYILIAGKPAGILSQKAKKEDLSLNEWLIGYLLQSGFLKADDLRMYKPSVCNRLDRNTSGIVLCAKSLQGAQLLGELLKNRTLHKYYQTYVKGQIKAAQTIEGILTKDESTNRVSIYPLPLQQERDTGDKGTKQTSYIKTTYKPLKIEGDKTLLEVELVTGKPHQIRAHLASMGHPLLGDYKYGDRAWNEIYRQKCGVQSQLLHAYKVVFPSLAPPFTDLDGRAFFCELPELFEHVQNICSCQSAPAGV